MALCGEMGAGDMGARGLGDVPIVDTDKATGAFFDAAGRSYSDAGGNVWVETGAGVGEGSIGYHGAGSHGGHIVLKPMFRYAGGRWLNMVTNRPLT